MGGTGKDAIFVGVDGRKCSPAPATISSSAATTSNFLLGNEGDDWIEGGGGFDTAAGDNSELFFNSAIIGHDVLFAGNDEMDFDAESGDDIMVQGESVMRNEGMFGFDWAIFKDVPFGAYADMRIPIFTTEEADILRNRFDKTEALSGWKHDDTLIGDNRTAPDLAGEEPGRTARRSPPTRTFSSTTASTRPASTASPGWTRSSRWRTGRSSSRPATSFSAARAATGSPATAATTSSTATAG